MNASKDGKLPLADLDVKQELISIEDKSSGEILEDLPSEVLEPIIRSTDAAKESTNPDDAASLNTCNDYWSISSIRSPPSNYEPNDIVDGVIIPPPLESPDDFILPLDTLLKPIKKNTYDLVYLSPLLSALIYSLDHKYHRIRPVEEKNAKKWIMGRSGKKVELGWRRAKL